ncbi:MAG TPA: hypothetical protein VE309_09020 [Caulobacteraceae bacterium]|nr:hypothetical protein [Caulobacteraceae bacterium]
MRAPAVARPTPEIRAPQVVHEPAPVHVAPHPAAAAPAPKAGPSQDRH